MEKTPQSSITIDIHSQDRLAIPKHSQEIKTHWPAVDTLTVCDSVSGHPHAVLFYIADLEGLHAVLSQIENYCNVDIPVVLIAQSMIESSLPESIDCICLPETTSNEVLSGMLYGLIQNEAELHKSKAKIKLMKQLHETFKEDVCMLQEELLKAAELQQSYMSAHLPEVKGLEISSYWKPVEVVSGDVYDIRQLDENKISIFIGDSIGHGISAAMLGMMATRTIAAHRIDQYTKEYANPSDVLTALNEALLLRTGTAARFLTAFYAVYDLETNILHFAGAGHPPAFVSNKFTTPKLLESDGPLLGVFENGTFPDSTLQLNEGDHLLLYSDGFEHLLPENLSSYDVPNHIQAMHELCIAHPSDPLHVIAEHAKNTFGCTKDDLTLLSLKVTSALTMKKAA